MLFGARIISPLPLSIRLVTSELVLRFESVKVKFESLSTRIVRPSVPSAIPVKVASPFPVYLNNDPKPNSTLFWIPVV